MRDFMGTMLRVRNLKKSFTLHNQGGVQLRVLEGMELEVRSGECVVLAGASGTGKSTFLRSLYANYRAEGGRILLRHEGGWVDMAGAAPRLILEVRKWTLGYVSQFLRVIPRVPALEVVMEKLLTLGFSPEEARDRSEQILLRLGIPERLWPISPTTFSGGEQQRINLARGFIYPYPILLLDEPTAALDAKNRKVVVALIREAKKRGAAIIGTFHDDEVRRAVATRILEMPGNGR
jgi:alpha-D-ribose 1-methylphosphonate 5-triphosphate synthase subunit PhnL